MSNSHLPTRIFRLFAAAALLCLPASRQAEARPMFPDSLTCAGEALPGDFDENGSVDSVCGSQTGTLNATMSISFNRGDGAFTRSATLALPASMSVQGVGDFNGDHHLDVILLSRQSPFVIATAFGRGDGSFDPVVPVFPIDRAGNPFGSSESFSTAVADFNEDGRADCATRVYSSTGIVTGIQILLSGGDGSYNRTTIVDFNQPFDIRAGDFDADGHRDLAFGRGSVGVLFGAGNGTFPRFVTMGTAFRSRIAVGDFDGDGRSDIVTLGGPPSFGSFFPLTIYYGQPLGTFSDGQRLPFVGGPDLLSAADLDGDGKADIVTGSGTVSIAILMNRASGFVQTQTMPTFGFQNELEFFKSADLDKDGSPDLIARNVFLRGHGDGTFDTGFRRSLPHIGSVTTPPAVGDLDGDGHPDLVLTQFDPAHIVPPIPTTGFVSVFRGAGDGTFADPFVLSDANDITGSVVSDFDGDGKQDVAVSRRFTSDIAIYRGRGDGTLEFLSSTPLPITPLIFASADLDGDGDIDLVVGSVVVRNMGGGVLSPEPSLGTSGTALVIADFNGDGRPDIVYLHGNSSPNLSMLLQNSDGSFGPEMTLPEPFYSNVATSGDFNGDGVRDLAVGGNLVGGFFGDSWILDGVGDGTFRPARQIPDSSSQPLATADFDQDGRDDLVFGVGSGVRILLQRGGGSFVSAGDYLQGGPLTTADFNGDSAPDLAGGGLIVSLNQGIPATNNPPVAAIEPVGQVECSGPSGGQVSLDGSGSTDPDSTPGTQDDIASYTWYEDYGTPAQRLLGSGAILNVVLPLGTHAVTLVVTDLEGATGRASTTMTVADTLPPSLSLFVSPSSLWPANHQMVPVHVTWLTQDFCDPTMRLELAAVVSSEPDDAPGYGDGATTGDIQDAAIGTADADLLLRAETSRRGPGRVYTLTYRAVDAAGNATTRSTTVTVAHDQGSGGLSRTQHRR